MRDHVLFAHDTAHTAEHQPHALRDPRVLRRADEVRALLRRRRRQARRAGSWGKDPGTKLYDVDAAFEDQEHEWYDLAEDPHEMVNLAHDRGRRAELAENYERLLEYEREELAQ